jgi:membrane-bound serine protease (ClpP class)
MLCRRSYLIPLWAICLFGHLLATVSAPLSRAQAPLNNLPDEGIFVNVPNPVTGEGVTRVKNSIEAARSNANRPIRKVVFTFNPSGKEASTTDFGAAYELAGYIEKLHDLSTIAFVSNPVSGHTILPVMACKEIVMSKNASFGEILPAGEVARPAVVSAYAEILGKTRESQLAVMKKLYDRGVSLGKGEKGGLPYYIDLRDAENLKKSGVKIPDPTPLPFAGPNVAAQLTAERLKSIGIVATTAESLEDVASLYSLSPSSLRESPLNSQAPVAYKLTLEGIIDGGVREAVTRTIEDVLRRKGNALFLELRCSGGDISAARDIADRLIEFQKRDPGVFIVGFIPNAAPDTAAIIALGCSEIVMTKSRAGKAGDESTFGDFDSVIEKDANSKELLKKNLTDLASRQGYPTLLVEGMIERDLVIINARGKVDRSRARLMTEAEYEANKQDWVSVGTVKGKGTVLKLTATQARDLRLVRFVVDGSDLNAVYNLYGVETSKVREATPGWLDRFANYLRMPAVTVLLVVIGFVGLILEIKLPGVTVPGIIAALCFILVFWAHSQYSGQTAILGGLIFLLGLLLILLEIFVIPGIGVPAVLGVLFMLTGIGLATVERIPASTEEWTMLAQRMGIYLAALFIAVIFSFTIARFLPQIPYVNRMVLQPPSDDPETATLSDLPGAALAASLLGAIGTSATPLRPAGMAQFGEQYVDVVTEGGFIATGARVQVVEVEGNRIVVKEI